MSTTDSTATYPPAIEFDCQACSSTLEVPFAALGVSGPCPYCGGTATAPSLEQWRRLQGMDVRPAPKPYEPLRTPKRKRRPTPPITQELHVLEDVWEKAPGAEKMINPDPRSKERVEGRLASIRERFRRTRIARVDDSGPSLQQILGWSTVGLSIFALGFGAAVVFYSVPLKAPPQHYEMPVDLTVQVLQEKVRQEKLRSQAMNEAQDAVAQFLHSGSAQGGKLQMFSPVGKPADFEPNLFPDLKRDNVIASSCTRITGSEDFLVTVEPQDERGPVFILQQQQGKLLLHADALTQQAGDTLNAFLNASGDASVVAYVLARPSQTQLPINGLEEWSKLDISPAFPSNQPRAFLASANPDGAAAEAIQNRVGTLHFTKAVAEFKWSKTNEGKRFIEVVRIIPNAWGKF